MSQNRTTCSPTLPPKNPRNEPSGGKSAGSAASSFCFMFHDEFSRTVFFFLLFHNFPLYARFATRWRSMKGKMHWPPPCWGWGSSSFFTCPLARGWTALQTPNLPRLLIANLFGKVSACCWCLCKIISFFFFQLRSSIADRARIMQRQWSKPYATTSSPHRWHPV